MIAQENRFITHGQHEEVIALNAIDDLIPILPFQPERFSNDLFAQA